MFCVCVAASYVVVCVGFFVFFLRLRVFYYVGISVVYTITYRNILLLTICLCLLIICVFVCFVCLFCYFVLFFVLFFVYVFVFVF